MRFTKNMKNNVERLCWFFMSWVLIFLGIFVEDLWHLIPIGTFIIGNILGSLSRK